MGRQANTKKKLLYIVFSSLSLSLTLIHNVKNEHKFIIKIQCNTNYFMLYHKELSTNGCDIENVEGERVCV